jgi:hypothetical protein
VVQPRRRSPTRHTSLLRLTHGCFLLSSSTQWELARFGRDLWLLEDEYGGEWRVASGLLSRYSPVWAWREMKASDARRNEWPVVTEIHVNANATKENRTEQNGLLMWVPRLCDRALFVSTMESGFIASSGQLITGNILYDCLIYFLWCLGNTCDNILSYFIVIVLFLHDHILIKIMSQTSYKIFIILGSM